MKQSDTFSKKMVKQGAKVGARKIWSVIPFPYNVIVIVAAVLAIGVLGITTAMTIFTSDDADCAPSQINYGGGDTITGNWAVKGSDPYNNAENIWNFWKSKGFSGAAIAGVLGNIAEEGGFTIPDRAQGHFTDGPDSQVSRGVVPLGGGAGPYQFTPYTKFAPLNSNKWLDWDAQNQYVWTSELQSAPWRNSYSLMSDPVKAAQTWFDKYERGQSYNPQKSGAATTAYQLFGGENISGSPVDDANQDNTNTDNSDNNADLSSDAQNGCDVTDGGDNSDNTGHAAKGAWANFNDLPADVKKYAHDPARVLGPRGNGDKWIAQGVTTTSYNQCVGLSVAYGNLIWGLSGNKTGNGIDTASGFAGQTGTRLSTKPTAGAIFSRGNDTIYGHTGIVQHVFENGDMLIVEQNYPGLSGEAGHQTFSWNFEVVTKAYMESYNAVYANPGANGQYKLKW